jgi:hypothetical protein
MMPEVDFLNFGISTNDELMTRINSCLNEIHALGDRESHAARIYFGGIEPAAKTLNISASVFREALRGQRRLNYRGLDEDVRQDLWDGASVILEMPDEKRTTACKVHSIPRENFMSQLRAWQLARDSQQFTQIVSNAVRLLDGYVRLWKYRHNPKIMFQASGFQRPAQALLKFREITERRALESKVCLVALEIIKEYETYLWHRQAVSRHIKVQRGIQSRNRTKLFEALVLRDGKSCVYCKSKRRLFIDHVKPLVRGGLTQMGNFSCSVFPAIVRRAIRLDRRSSEHGQAMATKRTRGRPYKTKAETKTMLVEMTQYRR